MRPQGGLGFSHGSPGGAQLWRTPQLFFSPAAKSPGHCWHCPCPCTWSRAWPMSERRSCILGEQPGERNNPGGVKSLAILREQLEPLQGRQLPWITRVEPPSSQGHQRILQKVTVTAGGPWLSWDNWDNWASGTAAPMERGGAEHGLLEPTPKTRTHHTPGLGGLGMLPVPAHGMSLPSQPPTPLRNSGVSCSS